MQPLVPVLPVAMSMLQWQHWVDGDGRALCAETVNTAVTLALTRLALDWHPGTWISGGVPTIPTLLQVAHSAYTGCINYMVYAKYLLFFWKSRTFLYTRQRPPM